MVTQLDEQPLPGHAPDLHEQPVAGAAPGEVPDVMFPALDTLRAVGAIAVLTTHVAFWSGELHRRRRLGHPARPPRRRRRAVLRAVRASCSSRPWLSRSLDGRPAPGTGRYLWKRALRIVPALPARPPCWR